MVSTIDNQLDGFLGLFFAFYKIPEGPNQHYKPCIIVFEKRGL
jgi:hypothetical protein